MEMELESWKYLRDESLRIEVDILVESSSQKAIVVGSKGDLIRQGTAIQIA